MVLALLKRQCAGDPDAPNKLRAWIVECGLHPADPLMQIVREWEGMFSYLPGRLEGLEVVVALTASLQDCQRSEREFHLYGRPEWKTIVELRGPAESVMLMRNTITDEQFITVGVSGFLDMAAYVCEDCGAALFRSVYDNSPLSECVCGSTYGGVNEALGQFDSVPGEYRCVWAKSPYEYFDKHTFRVDE